MWVKSGSESALWAVVLISPCYTQMEAEHCMLLAVPHGRDSFDFLQQQNSLRNGIINYLIMKQAAGIVNVSAPGTHQVGENNKNSLFLKQLHSLL